MSSDESDSGTASPATNHTHSLTHFPLIEQEKERKSPPTTNTTSSNNSLALTPTLNATQRKKRKRVKKLVTKMFVEEDGSMGE